MSVSTNIILDKRQIRISGTYPLKLSVNYKRVTKMYQTLFDLSIEDYERLRFPRISEKLIDVRHKLKSLQNEVDNFILKMEVFEFMTLERDFINNNDLIKFKKKN